MANRRMRSKSVINGLGLTLVAAAALSGCGSQRDYQAICVDPQTQQRLSDRACHDVNRSYDGTGGGYYWFYAPPGYNAPAVGQRYNPSRGVYKVPSGKTASKGGVSKSGGKVTRGGFGSGFGKSSS